MNYIFKKDISNYIFEGFSLFIFIEYCNYKNYQLIESDRHNFLYIRYNNGIECINDRCSCIYDSLKSELEFGSSTFIIIMDGK